MPKFFRFPWATTGDKTTIPDETDLTGLVSYQQGYGADYARDPATDPLAKLIERDKMNQLFSDLTENVQYWQVHSFPEYITADQNGGVAYEYDVDAIVRYDDGGGYKLYKNTVALNSDAPDVAGWVEGFGNYVGLTGDETIAGVKTFSSSPIVPNADASGEAVNFSQVIGIGQTWQNVLASRSAGVTYTNTTGKPIMVSIRYNSNGADNYITINGTIAYVCTHSSGNKPAILTVVPNNATYRLLSAQNSLDNWLELK